MYLQKNEQVLYSLRDLYRQFGYRQYKVTRFEEYDLYVRNKNFLVSKQMLTFTDTNGKLMALKPDITLSIVKNLRPQNGTVEKVYYSENVYRATDDINGFQEITQAGLECIGAVDDYTTCEVILLACRSLAVIRENYVLQLSHLGFLSGLLQDLPEDIRAEILRLIRAKNVPALKKYCKAQNVDAALSEKLLTLATAYGPLPDVLPTLESMSDTPQTRAALQELKAIEAAVTAWGLETRVTLDFSIVSDLNYYNGIVFQGYVDGLSSHILSGGRYDPLMERMQRKDSGIGFAVYASMLEQFQSEDDAFDGDVLLLYDDSSAPGDITREMELLTRQGKQVRAAREIPADHRYPETLTMKNGGICRD